MLEQTIHGKSMLPNLLQIIPIEILAYSGTYLSFHDLNKIALTAKMGQTCRLIFLLKVFHAKARQ